jgi:hypothetical protein
VRSIFDVAGVRLGLVARSFVSRVKAAMARRRSSMADTSAGAVLSRPAGKRLFAPRVDAITSAELHTVGIEEELFLVDEAELQCVEQMPEDFRLEAKAALGDHVKREIIGSMVELVTSVHV